MVKMVVLVRTDLGMKKGKLAVQTAHAVLGVYRKAKKAWPELVASWESEGEKKVTLKIGSQQELIDWRIWADSQGLTSYLVKDAGLTQLEPGTMTALAIGPAEPAKLKKTEQLQLL
ncbi:MAG: aminoacyl-tRNA hydrolase [Candidatus Altiarchaeota archaeon]|nr:aminoacyl-tRNA hydrolase [Candidatus Altiarchaeota archaeon]